MNPKLYIVNGSPPNRAILIIAKAVGLKIDVHVFEKNEDLRTPELLKINPAHTVPFFVDDNKIIFDSHAIAAYLIRKYGKDDSLYPQEVYKKAQVDEKLYFDTGVLFPTLRMAIGGIRRKEYKQIPQDKVDAIKEVYEIVEKFLDEKRWLVGENPTIADISYATTISTTEILCPIDSKVYPNLGSWLKRVQLLPYFKEDDKQIEYFKEFLKRLSNWV